MSQKKTEVKKDPSQKKLTVTREFDAPVEEVWKAWTDPSILDKWWAPKPWKAKTKSMDFRPGGSWLYSMQGPNGEEHFSKADFKTVTENKEYTGDDCFCDAEGNIDKNMPVTHWHVKFSSTANGTLVTSELTFDSEEQMNKLIEMGFEEGFSAAHGNLDEVLK